MYRACSLYLCCRLLLVCPIYDSLHALQVSMCIPLLSWSCVLWHIFVFLSCCNVLVFLKATRTFVCLSMFVIFLINGLWYVNFAQIFLTCCSLFVWSLSVCFCCIWWFSRCMSVWGELLFCAISCIVAHSFCFLWDVSSTMCILAMWCLYAAILCSIGWLNKSWLPCLWWLVFDDYRSQGLLSFLLWVNQGNLYCC